MNNILGENEELMDEKLTEEMEERANRDEGNEGMEAPEAAGLLDFLARMKGIMPEGEDGDEEDSDGMDANDYHNKAVEFSRRGKFRQAIDLCVEGLDHYPNNVDLIADTIKYCSESGDMEKAAEFFQVLKQTIPYHRWNWRAFTFSFDYLMEEDPEKNEEICRDIITNYKKYLPYEEKACMAESELEAALGNTQRSMEVLEKAVETHPNACQCALKLADMQLERGLFEEVVNTANYGISASVEVQPSINIPYLLLVRTLAKDALLHRKLFSDSLPSRKDVDEVSEEYDLLVAEFPELMRHAHVVSTRKKMLKFIRTAE